MQISQIVFPTLAIQQPWFIRAWPFCPSSWTGVFYHRHGPYSN